MSGHDLPDTCVIIAVTGSGLCLSYFLFGVRAVITLAGITVAGIVLKRVLSVKPATRSRKVSRKPASSRIRSRSADATVQTNKENIPPPAYVTPGGWVSKRPRTRKASRPLEGVSLLGNFDEVFSA